MWLALSGAIYSRITLSFALNRIFFSANENGKVKQNNQSDFKAFFKLTKHIAEEWTTKSRYLANLAIKLCDFKMDLIKWQLNFGSCNFGLKSYFWFQIQLALRACSIMKSRVWFQAKLHSTQFNHHYKQRWYIIIYELLLYNTMYIEQCWTDRFLFILTELANPEGHQSWKW